MVSFVMGLIVLIVVLAIVYLVILYLNGTFSKGGRNPPEDELKIVATKPEATKTVPKAAEAPKSAEPAKQVDLAKPAEPMVVAPSDAVAVPKDAPITTIKEETLASTPTPPAK